jgi:hypothetical protein
LNPKFTTSAFIIGSGSMSRGIQEKNLQKKDSIQVKDWFSKI